MAKSRTIGLEIEFLLPTNHTSPELASALTNAGIPTQSMGYTHLITDGFKIVTDSSVRNPGYRGLELVSPILTLAKLKKIMPIIERVLTAHNAKINRSCGLHIHHDASDYTLDSFKNLYANYKNNETIIDSIMPHSRRGSSNSYCGSMTNPHHIASITSFTDTIPSFIRCFRTRFLKLNFQSFTKYGTIEIRHHAGTFSATKIINWATLSQKLVAYSKTKTYTASDIKDFIMTICAIKKPAANTAKAALWAGYSACSTLKDFQNFVVDAGWSKAAANWIWGDINNYKMVSFFQMRQAQLV